MIPPSSRIIAPLSSPSSRASVGHPALGIWEGGRGEERQGDEMSRVTVKWCMSRMELGGSFQLDFSWLQKDDLWTECVDPEDGSITVCVACTHQQSQKHLSAYARMHLWIRMAQTG